MGSRGEAVAHVHHLLEADGRHHGLGRHVFAERHQTILVVDPQQLEIVALAADRVEAVVEGRLHRVLVDAVGPDQKNLAGLQDADHRLVEPQVQARVEQVVGRHAGDRALRPDDDVRGVSIGRRLDG